MAVAFNEISVWPEVLTPGVARQRLLHPARVPNTRVLLDRIKLGAGTSIRVQVAPPDLAWFQMLEGTALLTHGAAKIQLGATHIVFLPAGFDGTLATKSGATLLSAQVPHAARFDAGFAHTPPPFRIVDWMREPVFDSAHDARKCIYVATPNLSGTRAIKGEVIIYPPGTSAAKHHYQGAEHFMYVLKGGGTAYANEKPLPVRRGELVYYADCERNYLRNDGGEELILVEFVVPGEYETVWAPGAAVCTWTPSGRTIRGDPAVREIQAHSSAQPTLLDV